MKTELKRLYEIIDLEKNNLIVLAGRPATGKSSLALSIVNNIAVTQNISTLIFSLEMSEQTVLNKMESTSNIFINDTAGISINKICEEARKMKEEKDIELIVLDYLQLVSYTGTEITRAEEVSKITKTLKALVEELNITIIVTSQLSKIVDEREDKRPKLEDFNESKSVVQYADIILFLYRDDFYNKDIINNNIEVIIAKNKTGTTGTIEIPTSEVFKC